jgi:hypothetical protein
MKTRKIDKKGIVRFTGGGALLTAMIGLILLSPLSASGQDASDETEAVAVEAGGHELGALRAGPHRFGPGMRGGHHRMGRGMDIELMTIVLEMSDRQVEEVEKLLEEHQDKMDDQFAEAWKKERRQARKNRVHRRSGYDRVRSGEAREKMRRERSEKREEMRELRDQMRDELDGRLAGVLDDGQMKKLREMRELREARREEIRQLREERREERAKRCEAGEGRHERRGRGR